MAKKDKNITQGIQLYKFLEKKNQQEIREIINSLDEFYSQNNISFDANEEFLRPIKIFLGNKIREIIIGDSEKAQIIYRIATLSGQDVQRKNKVDFYSRVSAIQNVFENERTQQDLLMNYVDENVRLIKGVDDTKADRIMSIVMNAIQQGQSKNSIKSQLKDVVARTNNGYKFIARDQSAKLYSSITEVRAKANNWEFYEWEDSNDIKVRTIENSGGYKDHAHLDGKIYRFSEPPRTTYKGKGPFFHNPGFDYGCRCVAKILFDPPEAFKKNSDGSYSYKSSQEKSLT